MASASSIKAGSAFIELFVNDSKLVKGLERASKRLKAFGEGIRGLGTKIAAIGAAVTAPLIGFAKVFASSSKAMEAMSQRTGIGVEALSELGYAAQLSGTDMETLELGIRRMQKSIISAAQGSKLAVDALAQLGLTVDDLRGLSPEQQFKLIADRLSQVQSPALRAALALQLLGRSGTRLLPMMKGGAAGIEAMQKQARDLGLTASGAEVAVGVKLEHALQILWDVLKRLASVVGSTLAPMLTAFAERVTELVVKAIAWAKQNRDLIVSVFKVALAVKLAGLALVVIGTAFTSLGGAVGTLAAIIGGLGSVMSVIAAAIGAVLSPIGLVITAVVALGAYLIYVSGIGGEALAWLGDRFTDLKDFAIASFGGIADALAAGDIALAAKILWLTLKVAWEKGVGWIEGIWLSFRGFFIQTAYDAFYGALAAWEIIQHGLEVAWIETTAFLSKTWTSFTAGFTTAWNDAINWTTKRLLELQGLFDSSLDVDAAKKMADSELASTNAEIERQKKAALDAREQQRQAERTQSSKEHDAEMGRIGQESIDKQKALEDQHAAKVKQAEDELARARKELKDALGEAKQKRQEKEAQGPKKTEAPPAIPDLLEGLGPALQDAQKRTIGVAGTFNAWEARGLGAGNVADRIAKAAEQTAKNTKDMLDEIQDMDGPEFE